MISIGEEDLARLLQENVLLSKQVTELQEAGTELLMKMRAAVKGEIEVPIKTCGVTVPGPRYQTDGAAGLDLCTTKGHFLSAGGWCRLPTGVAIELPKGYMAKVVPRSSVSMRGIVAIDGTIDWDYRGEINIVLHNIGHEGLLIEAGSRIAQLLIMPVMHANLVEVETLTETTRGEAGFGSTG